MSMKNDFYSRGRAVSDLKAHLVLTTKYRRKVFTAEMLTRLHEITEYLLFAMGMSIRSARVVYDFIIPFIITVLRKNQIISLT